MIQSSQRFSCLALMLALFLAAPAIAGEAKPVQLALFNPAQLFREDVAVQGVRLSLIYGKNTDVSGLDWGLVSHTTGNSVAWQTGGLGLVEGNFQGLQSNWINITRGKCEGVQWGVFNQAGSGHGLALGFVNVAKDMRGVQVGFVNITETMHGLQIGLANIIEKGDHPFLPIVNWSR